MGDMTFTNFKDYLKVRFGGNVAFETPTNYYGIWVNEAYRRLTSSNMVLGRRLNIPELETSTTSATVDGTASVSVPSDCLSIIEVFDNTNTKRLDQVPLSQYIAKTDRADTTAEGKPEKWHRSGAYIWLWPTPDDAYTLEIYYRKRPTALSSGSDVTILGSEWDDVIIEMAHAIGRDWSGEPEKAKVSNERANEMIINLIGIYERENKARRERVQMDPSIMSETKNTY